MCRRIKKYVDNDNTTTHQERVVSGRMDCKREMPCQAGYGVSVQPSSKTVCMPNCGAYYVVPNGMPYGLPQYVKHDESGKQRVLTPKIVKMGGPRPIKMNKAISMTSPLCVPVNFINSNPNGVLSIPVQQSEANSKESNEEKNVEKRPIVFTGMDEKTVFSPDSPVMKNIMVNHKELLEGDIFTYDKKKQSTVHEMKDSKPTEKKTKKTTKKLRGLI